jgi:hypothetical protein
MKTKFWKGLMMSLAGVIVAGMSTHPILWSIIIVTLICTILTYVAKNTWIHTSTSPEGELNWQDIFAALLMAVSVGIGNAITSIAGSGIIDWMLLLKTAGSVSLTYLSATVFTGSKQ